MYTLHRMAKLIYIPQNVKHILGRNYYINSLAHHTF